MGNANSSSGAEQRSQLAQHPRGGSQQQRVRDTNINRRRKSLELPDLNQSLAFTQQQRERSLVVPVLLVADTRPPRKIHCCVWR
jgi:hypothetical protein